MKNMFTYSAEVHKIQGVKEESMKKIRILALVFPVMIFCAFTYPWEAQPQKKEGEATPKPKQIQEYQEYKETPGGTKEQETTYIQAVTKAPEKITNEPQAGVINQAAIQPISVPVISKIEKLSASHIQPIQPIHPIDNAPNIQKIQKQINDIIKLQETLKQTQQGQLSEIQKIIDQAKIHQRILDDIKMTKASRERVTPAATEQLLEQEKVRLIGNETEQNKKRLENLAQGGEKPEVKQIQKTEKSVVKSVVAVKAVTGAAKSQAGQTSNKNKTS